MPGEISEAEQMRRLANDLTGESLNTIANKAHFKQEADNLHAQMAKYFDFMDREGFPNPDVKKKK